MKPRTARRFVITLPIVALMAAALAAAGLAASPVDPSAGSKDSKDATDARDWTVRKDGAEAYAGWSDVSARDPKNAWVIGTSGGNGDGPGQNRVGRWDGTRWTVLDRAPGADGTLAAIRTFAPNDTWIFGTHAFHWGGTRWSKAPAPLHPGEKDLRFWAADGYWTRDIWAVGEYDKVNSEGNTDTFAKIVHWDGNRWKTTPAPDFGRRPGRLADIRLRSVVAVNTKDAWAVGSNDGDWIAIRWNGTKWSKVALPPLKIRGWSVLNKVAKVGPRNVWALGRNYTKPVAMHYDGVRWRIVRFGKRDGSMHDVTPDGQGGVWIAGSDHNDQGYSRPYLLHWTREKGWSKPDYRFGIGSIGQIPHRPAVWGVGSDSNGTSRIWVNGPLD